MLILSSGHVWLEAGEQIPCVCSCGHLYQPETKKRSYCPKCRRENDHDGLPFFAAAEFEADD